MQAEIKRSEREIQERIKKNGFIILEEQSTNVDKEIQWETAYNESTMSVLELEDGQRRRKITR